MAEKQQDEISGKAYDARLMRRLTHYLRPYWWQVAVSLISVILKASSDAAGPFLIKTGIDRYLTAGGAQSGWLARHLSNSPLQGITQITTIYLGILASSYLFEFAQTYLMQWVGQNVMFDLRREIFRHMQQMHIGFFDQNSVGRLVTRITSDVDAINEMFTAGVLSMIDDLFALTIMVGVMLSMNWRLALLTLSVLPLIILCTHLFRTHVRESYRRVRAAIARINSFTQEHISGMSVVQLFNREKRAYDDFETVNRDHMIAFKDTIFAYALYYPAVDLLSSIAIALVIWRGGHGVLENMVTIGVLTAFIQYSQRFFRPIQDLSEKFNILQSAMTACERIFMLLDTKPQITSPAKTVEPIAAQTGRIEFDHVWFTYQPLTEEQKHQLAVQGPASLTEIEWILKDVSFTIEPGSTVAIVGHTGAGKTTLTSLMMRFYDIASGSVRVDGVDVREQDLNTLRRDFAVVLQDPFLFSGTIAENIRLGNSAIDDRCMREAARDVNVLDFIESLPNQFNEPLRERGNSLSTGQKQLINFARALAFNPQILILDEATSSVDTDTELRIRSALDRMVTGRTSVLIAHRLSTIQRADKILVMHKAELREIGTHQELLALRGLYWRLYRLQYKDQEMPDSDKAAPILDVAQSAPLAAGNA